MVNYEKMGCLFGIGGIVCSIYLYIKLRKIAAKVDMSLDELSSKTHVDVEKSMINQAIQMTIEREVSKLTPYASRDAVLKISQDMSFRVREVVEASYSDLRSSVSYELSRQVANIDKEALRKDVTAKAKEAILEKFDGNLDHILNEYKRNLENVSSIYESIAGSMGTKQGKEMIFKIS